jgi:tRNA(Ile)-lysidine synthase
MSSSHGLVVYDRSVKRPFLMGAVQILVQTAVASSAGPDSTCLLFLLHRMIYSKQRNKDPASADHPLPDSILSLHVDHNLQSDAEKMARAARAAARRYKSTHAELRVRWGEPPFPPRPLSRPRAGEGENEGEDEEGESSAIESVARIARYRLLFDAMVRRGAHVLATGHHADDQVETVLMRLGSGSSVLGLGGMRPSRRFGMALGNGEGEGDYGWFGREGLSRWIVRPLLNVPKVSCRASASLSVGE